MMLTLATAKQMGVTNRLDPEQSIMGGTRYIDQLIKKIPERIQGPDRLWFALASYNIGFGHLEDARIITEKQGGNPDKWREAKNYLPYLQNSQWYKQTLYGYARGIQAVSFVERIRKYYNTLIQLTHEDEPIQDRPTKESIRMVDLDSRVL
jgi:membrane-bound lytic murein transglycosylase F